VAPGKAASLLVLTEDPLVNPLTLATPEQVWIDGRVRR
jgi:imidazolonepropionase-like amidohydrolase